MPKVMTHRKLNKFLKLFKNKYWILTLNYKKITFGVIVNPYTLIFFTEVKHQALQT